MSSISKHLLFAQPVPVPVPSTNTDVFASTLSKVRRRSNSFASSFKRLLPNNRPEKGGTLRKRGCHSSEHGVIPISKSGPSVLPSNTREVSNKVLHWNTAVELPGSVPPSVSTADSSPGTRSLNLYLERRDKRQQRRSLKESGDYLGVQGINPSTGEMDVLTPSSGSTPSSQFASLAQSVQDKRGAYERAKKALRAEKMRRWEMDKEALKKERKRKVKWAKAGSGWSSVIEPDLSPISGSSATTSGEGSTATIVRTPRHRSEEEESGPGDAATRALTDSASKSGPAVSLAACSTSRTSSGIPRKPLPTGSHALGALPKPPPRSSITGTTDGGHGQDPSTLGPWGSHYPGVPLQARPKVGPKPVG